MAVVSLLALQVKDVPYLLSKLSPSTSSEARVFIALAGERPAIYQSAAHVQAIDGTTSCRLVGASLPAATDVRPTYVSHVAEKEVD